jgi:hypothetical protein
MRKLDRTRDFGTFRGHPYQPEGCDRVAAYQQDDRFFDVNDREIVPGVSLAAARARRRQADADTAEAAAELLAHAHKMQPALFKSMARILLGPKNIPAKKADIVAALEALLARSRAGAPSEDDEDAGEVPPAGKANGRKGVSFQSMAGARPAAPAPTTKPQPAKSAPPPQGKNGANVNLAAWGRGTENHTFNDIRTAIEERLGVSVTDAPAALETLIDKGLVAFKDARKDLLPPAVEVEDHEDA